MPSRPLITMADGGEESHLQRSSKDSKESARKESRKHRKRSRSSESSSDSSGSSSSSSNPVRKKPRASKLKKRKARRSPSTDTDRSVDSTNSETRKKRHRRKEDRRKQGKKSRKKKEKAREKEKRSKTAVNQDKYGKYGILVESDMFNKQQEFYLWLQEVKKINPEVFPRSEMKKMFETFAEDYNTVTLPHKKFYDLEKWEAKQRKKGRLKALKKAQKQQVSIENDELRHKSLHSGPIRSGMSKADLLEMQRVMRERQQEDYKKKAGMKLDETKGVRYHTMNP